MKKKVDTLPPGLLADNKRKKIETEIRNKLLTPSNLKPRTVLTSLTLDGVTGNLIIPTDNSGPPTVNFTPPYNWN